MSDNATPQSPQTPGPQTPAPRRPARRRRGLWASVALVVVLAGVVGSVLGAHALARTEAAKARLAFHLTSAGVASTLKLAVQREEDLAAGASAFFAANPTASSSEFATWADSVSALKRDPALVKLGLVTVVPAQELPAFEARVTGTAAKPRRAGATAAKTEAAPGGGQLRIVPAGARAYYCLLSAGLARGASAHSPAGLDYCAVMPGLLLSRDTATNTYAPVAVGRTGALAIDTPVYRGGQTPATAAARMGAFVGWLRQVVVPQVVLSRALQGHPQTAARLRFQSGASAFVFTSGTPQPEAQTRTTRIQGGWSVKSFGPPANASGLGNAHARALLIGGVVLSVVLGLLVFLLGSRPGPAPVPAPAPIAPPRGRLYDQLTGLPNRELMLDRAERMLARAGRQPGLLVGALFIDIDGFKSVNEKLGQSAGDQLLKVVAQRLEGVVRAQDTVGRLGGDEFVVLVEATARGVRLESLAGRVVESLHKPVELEGVEPSFFLTASIGVAFGRYATPEDLLRDAHLALYAAKAAGKDRYTLFNANMRSVIEGDAQLEVELSAALEEHQFFLLYQPIYDLDTRKLVGLEALIRWLHPSQRVLGPADFLGLAEETRLIVPLGRWVLLEACNRAATWNVAGHRVGISVNISAYQLDRDGFVTDVRSALQQSGLEPSLLTLEVPETMVMRNVAAVTRRMQELKALGVRIAIDDFGSGYAYHSHLQQMPLDCLKVDRNTLAQSDPEDYRGAMLEAILDVGRELSLAVVAKGTETREQLAELRALGCTLAQGFLLGKPMPVEALGGLFEAGFPVEDPDGFAAERGVEGAPAPASPAAHMLQPDE